MCAPPTRPRLRRKSRASRRAEDSSARSNCIA
jgi:hypothetical protein